MFANYIYLQVKAQCKLRTLVMVNNGEVLRFSKDKEKFMTHKSRDLTM